MKVFIFLFVLTSRQVAAAGAVKAVYNRVMHMFSQPPIPGAGSLTQDMCRKKLFTNVDLLFAATRGGANTCEQAGKDPVGKKRADLLAPTQAECEAQDWVEGSKDASGKQCAATFSEVPAILGFGGPINDKCGFVGSGDYKADEGIEDIGKCCMKAGSFYHRLFLKKWSFCQNLKWLLCVAQGFAKGQAKGSNGGKILFVTQASDMLVEEADTAQSVGVTVHEFCTLDRVCSNNKDLWKVKPGVTFECKFSGFTKKGEAQVESFQVSPPLPPPAAHSEVGAETAVKESLDDYSVGVDSSSSNRMILGGAGLLVLFALYFAWQTKPSGDSANVYLLENDEI